MIRSRLFSLFAICLLMSSCDALEEKERYTSRCENDEGIRKMLSDSPRPPNNREFCECTYGWLTKMAIEQNTSVTEMTESWKSANGSPPLGALAIVPIYQNCLLSSTWTAPSSP